MNKKMLLLITSISNIYVGSLISMHVLARGIPHARSLKASYSSSPHTDMVYVYNTHQNTVTIDDREYAIDKDVPHQILKEKLCADGESEFLVRENKYSRAGIGYLSPWICNGFVIEKRKTQPTTETLPYLSKMGVQSILFSIADNKEVKKTFAQVPNDGNHGHTVKLLHILEHYLKDAHHGYKPRIDPMLLGQVKDAFKCCFLAIPPLLVTAGPIAGYYTGDVELAMILCIAGIHPVTFLGCVIIPSMQDNPSARDSVRSLLYGQDKDSKQKEMQQFFALANDLYREGKKPYYSHE